MKNETLPNKISHIDVDFGNHWTKIMVYNSADKLVKQRKLSPMILPADKVGTDQFGDKVFPESIFESSLYPGEEYYFGDILDSFIDSDSAKEIRSSLRLDNTEDTILSGNRYNSKTFKLVFEFTIAEILRKYDKDDLVLEIVTGLPDIDLQTESTKEAMVSLLESDHKVKVGDTWKTFSFKEFITPGGKKMAPIISQHMGTMFYLISTGEQVRNKTIAIVDAGGGTVVFDVVSNTNGIPLVRHDAAYTWPLGAQNLRTSLNRVLRLNEIEIDEMLRNGVDKNTFTYQDRKGKKQSATTVVREERDKYTNRVVDALVDHINRLDDIETIDSIYFTGGASNLFIWKTVENTFPQAKLVDNSEWANVKGYHVWGRYN